jgi:hypothetical protein
METTMSRLTTLTLAALGVLAASAADAGPAALASASPGAFSTAPALTQVHYRGGYYGYRSYRPYGYYYSAPLYVAPRYVAPSGCGWLRVKALDTGSRYWWRRYRDCIG